jgi:hypothetical protein
MSEIHILDREVRPESLCGYTGPPGAGVATCAACIAVDQQLVFPVGRWDRARDVVVFPAAVVLVCVMALAAFTGTAWLSWVAGVAAGAVMLVGVPLTLVLSAAQDRRYRGELIETGA